MRLATSSVCNCFWHPICSERESAAKVNESWKLCICLGPPVTLSYNICICHKTNDTGCQSIPQKCHSQLLHLCLGFRRIECNLQKKTLDLYVAKVLKDCLSWQAWLCHSFCSLYRTVCLLQLKIGTGRNIGKVKSRYSYHHVCAICYS